MAQSKRHRVLLISGEYPPMEGGVADYTRLLAEHLGGLGVAAAVLTDRRATSGSNPHPCPIPKGDGDAASRVENCPRSSTVGEDVANPPAVYPQVAEWGFRFWRDVDAVAAAFRPDIVHIQYQTGAFALKPAINLLPLQLRRRRPRPAVVVTFHDLRTPYLFPKAGQVRVLTNRILAWSADAVIVTNLEDEVALLRVMPRHRLRAIPIPPNVPAVELDASSRRCLRSRLGIDDDMAAVGYFGLINQSKGLTTLLEAIRQLRAEHHAVVLVVIGGGVGATDLTNASELSQFRKTIGQLGLEGVDRWTGWLAPLEASRMLAACDAVALPYRDGASIRRATLLAALANGLPTVTTLPTTPDALAAPDHPEIRIVDGQQAFLVAPDDAAALANALRRALFEPDCRERLRRLGRAFARGFTWEHAARRTVDLYQSLGT